MKPFGLNILILKSHRANVCLKCLKIFKNVKKCFKMFKNKTFWLE